MVDAVKAESRLAGMWQRGKAIHSLFSTRQEVISLDASQGMVRQTLPNPPDVADFNPALFQTSSMSLPPHQPD